MIRTFSLILALCCLPGVAAFAADVDCDSIYCYSAEEFSPEGQLEGICVTGLPAPDTGTVLLGQRVIRPGDILTADQLDRMTFAPLRTESDTQATVTYLPIYADRVEDDATMTLSIRGKKDHAPVAEDLALETYKNLPNQGHLKVHDPEGQPMTYSVVRQPRRGQVTVDADGSFTYTPKRNKVGVDSFTYTAVDPAGNVSREATVTVQILKPADAAQYTDTLGHSCRFAAEWMKNTGIFTAEQVSGVSRFQPEKTVSRGEFLTMLVKTIGIPTEESVSFTGFQDEIPTWLRPYLAAALRAGLTAGLPVSETGVFGAEESITGAEAAVMMNNAMDLSVVTSSMGEMNQEEPAWAMGAVAAMNENGIALTASQTMTRGQVAKILYQVSKMAQDIPALAMYQ